MYDLNSAYGDLLHQYFPERAGARLLLDKGINGNERNHCPKIWKTAYIADRNRAKQKSSLTEINTNLKGLTIKKCIVTSRNADIHAALIRKAEPVVHCQFLHSLKVQPSLTKSKMVVKD